MYGMVALYSLCACVVCAHDMRALYMHVVYVVDICWMRGMCDMCDTRVCYACVIYIYIYCVCVCYVCGMRGMRV